MSTLSFSAQDAIAKDDTLYDSFVRPSVCLLHCGIVARNCVNKLLSKAIIKDASFQRFKQLY